MPSYRMSRQVAATIAAVALLVIVAALVIWRMAAKPRAAAPPAAKEEPMEPATSGLADSVQRANGRIWIDGLQDVDFGGSYLGRQDSQVACLTAALRCAGHDVTYSDVMRLSGAAFKLTLSPNIGLPEVHSEFGMDFRTFLREAFAMEYTNRSVIHDEPRTGLWRKAFIAQARPLIERGIPLIFMDGEWNLMVGFAEDGSGFLCVPYAGTNGRGYPFTTSIVGGCDGNAWGVYFLTPLNTPAKDHHQVVIESLHQAQRFANHAPQARGARDGLYWGFAAYEIWMDALEHRPEKTYPQCNGFSYSQLLTSRQAVADYLRTEARAFDSANGDRLLAAADRYAAIAARLRAGSDCVATPYERTWNAANRAREIELLRQCLADERAAVALIAQVAPLPAPAAAAPATTPDFTLLPTPGKPGATTDFALAPDVSLRAALIPSGEFLMGPKASGLTPGEQRRVILTRPFRMGVYPVTIGQFAAFAADTGYVTDAEREGFAMAWVDGQGWVIKPGWSYRNPGYASDPTLPAVCVTYNDATAFCQWASRKLGRTVRLPTDAEREYACRAGTTTNHYWGDAPDTAQKWAYPKPEEQGVAPYTVPFSKPQGTYPANPWGLYDMCAGIYEFCLERCPDSADGAVLVDPRGPAGGRFAIRGSSNPSHQRGNDDDRTMRSPAFGFRVVVEIPEAP